MTAAMKAAVKEAVKRRDVAQAAVDRFKDAPFEYGKNDCARMAVFVLRGMGHRPKLAKAGSYSSALGAARAMRRLGHDSLAEALDAIGLRRIPPASAVVADLVMVPGEGPFGGSLHVAVGNGRVLGYHEDIACADILQPVEYIAAWRTSTADY